MEVSHFQHKIGFVSNTELESLSLNMPTGPREKRSRLTEFVSRVYGVASDAQDTEGTETTGKEERRLLTEHNGKDKIQRVGRWEGGSEGR